MVSKPILSISGHARARCQQRAIPEDIIEQLVEYGRPYHAGEHCFAFLLGGRALRKRRDLPHRLRDYFGVAVLCSDAGRVLTVMRVQSVPRHWKPARRLPVAIKGRAMGGGR